MNFKGLNMIKTQEEIHKLIVGTFGTDIGKKLLEHLKTAIIDRPTYKKDSTLDECAFREGQKDIINQFLKEIK